MKFKFSIVIFLLFQIITLGAQSDIKVLNSDKNSIIIEFTPIYLNNSDVVINNETFKRIDLKYGLVLNEDNIGSPAVQHRYIDLIVPNEVGNTVSIISSQYELIDGKIAPINSLSDKTNEDFLSNYSSYNESENLVDFGDFGNTRGVLNQTFIINPIKYDVNQGKIKLYKKIVFKVNFSSVSNLSFKTDKYSDANYINYEQALSWNKYTPVLSKTSTDSPLSTGTWFKVAISEEGIYKIDRTFLSNMGINVSTLDPRTIKIYNNGGNLLPEDPERYKPNDLVENAIFVSGENDGTFDSGDYILFYGRGVDFYEYNTSSKLIVRNKSYYSKVNYYFLTFGGVTGKRMENIGNAGSTSGYNQTSTYAFNFSDNDKVNLLKSGRLAFGDEFNTSIKSRSYITAIPNRVEGTPIVYKYQVGNYSQEQFSMNISESQTTLVNTVLSGGYSYAVGKLFSGSVSVKPTITDSRSVLNFSFGLSNSSQIAYLDYYEIQYQKYLKASNDELIFYSKDTTATINYYLSNFSNSDVHVFDITNYNNVKIVNSSISAGDVNFYKNEQSGNVSKYLSICSTLYKTPGQFTAVENSNVHGISQGAEYLIIAHKAFKAQAEKFANYRANNSPYPISTQIVYIDEIINEFNSGVLDPTVIRNFLQYAYNNWQTRPFYVLLMGDGDYDYFNFEGYNTNFIPTFQTFESFDEVSSFPYDDYYTRVAGGSMDSKVDFALGRWTIKTPAEGDIIINKIIQYESNTDKGLWQNNITLVADDGLTTATGNDGSMHTGQSEFLANSYIPSFVDLDKIYLSMYPTVITGLGRRKPAVTEAIVDAVNNGTLILNYIGHGNPNVWAHEYVFERTTTIPLFNNNRYFFLTAATCDFGKYDDPVTQSSTEDMLVLPNSGMIAGFSAVRPVVSTENAALNNMYYSYLFEEQADGLTNPTGRAYYQTKQQKTNDNAEKFHFFGDPYLRLSRPNTPVEIDSINGNSSVNITQLKALSKSRIVGHVYDNNGNINNNFNGEGIITVFDSKRTMYLSDINYNINLQGGVIFRGRVTINNGKFDTEFTVPKDISYENKNGKVVIYVYSNDVNGIGFTSNVIIGGSDSTVVDDKKGPEIAIYFDNLDFDNAKLVNPDFDLLVKLYDDAGLNTTGTGVGHKLQAIVNNNDENPVDLTNFFIGDLDAAGKSGIVDYKFSNQSTGDYSILVKAWDIFNNFSSQDAYYTVVDGNSLTLSEIVNYPNPFSNSTTFTFQHNFNSDINVKIKIYTIAGRMIKEIEENNIVDRFVKINWDGRDEDNNRIANGTYLYKVIVETTDGSSKQSVLGKLAIIK